VQACLAAEGWDLDAAYEALRRKGLAAAAKKAGRHAADGLVGLAVVGHHTGGGWGGGEEAGRLGTMNATCQTGPCSRHVAAACPTCTVCILPLWPCTPPMPPGVCCSFSTACCIQHTRYASQTIALLQGFD
jgi:hypothetical protein